MTAKAMKTYGRRAHNPRRKPLKLPLPEKTRDALQIDRTFPNHPKTADRVINNNLAAPAQASSLDWQTDDIVADVSAARPNAEPAESPNPLSREDVLPRLPPSSALKAKMSSAGSPTQTNNGRDYDQYFRGSSTCCQGDDGQGDGPSGPAVTPSNRPRPGGFTSDRGSGAADTDLDYTGEHSTMSYDTGLVDFGSLARRKDSASQTQTLTTPGTPVSHNPFPGSRSQVLNLSQLFRNTQPSSALRRESPTSSRPSPDLTFNQPHFSANVTSPLKTHATGSSPALLIPSSPLYLPGIKCSRTPADDSDSLIPASAANPIITDSPRHELHKTKPVAGSREEYEPMQKSQERRSSSVARDCGSEELGDEDTDDSMSRRGLTMLRRKAAVQRLVSITLETKSRRGRVNKKPEGSMAGGEISTAATGYVAQHCRKSTVDSKVQHAEDTVADSPTREEESVRPPELNDGESTQSEAEYEPDAELNQKSGPTSQKIFGVSTLSNATDERKRDDDQADQLIVDSDNAVLETSLGGKASPQTFCSSPPVLRKPAGASVIPEASIPTGSASSLSLLASTPIFHAETAPASEAGRVGKPMAEAKKVDIVPPVPAKHNRRKPLLGITRARMTSNDNLRQSARLSRKYSISTDQLLRSPTAAPVLEHSILTSRTPMLGSSTFFLQARVTHQEVRIFRGMAFAISFQSRRDGETDGNLKRRTQISVRIEQKIKDCGGTILKTGFEELFEAQPIKSVATSLVSGSGGEQELNLTAASKSTGFAALIADGHSRKVKYIQALALGLPCIAYQWIDSCLKKKEIVDWSPYLLCAGQSTLLGDAIRSRNLMPYDASTAQLSRVIEHRTKLLRGSKILLVLKKGVKRKNSVYVFLARVLGASFSRVSTLEEAKVEIRKREAAGEPFDWVYTDGKSDVGELAERPKATESRKRKRASLPAATEPPAKKVRTLSDELVVQSLILGRLIEDDERNGI